MDLPHPRLLLVAAEVVLQSATSFFGILACCWNRRVDGLDVSIHPPSFDVAHEKLLEVLWADWEVDL